MPEVTLGSRMGWRSTQALQNKRNKKLIKLLSQLLLIWMQISTSLAKHWNKIYINAWFTQKKHLYQIFTTVCFFKILQLVKEMSALNTSINWASALYFKWLFLVVVTFDWTNHFSSVRATEPRKTGLKKQVDIIRNWQRCCNVTTGTPSTLNMFWQIWHVATTFVLFYKKVCRRR